MTMKNSFRVIVAAIAFIGFGLAACGDTPGGTPVPPLPALEGSPIIYIGNAQADGTLEAGNQLTANTASVTGGSGVFNYR